MQLEYITFESTSNDINRLNLIKSDNTNTIIDNNNIYTTLFDRDNCIHSDALGQFPVFGYLDQKYLLLSVFKQFYICNDNDISKKE